jgi:hypothetical protein
MLNNKHSFTKWIKIYKKNNIVIISNEWSSTKIPDFNLIWHLVCSSSGITAYEWLSKRTGATHGAGTAYPSRAPVFTPVFSGVHFAWSLVFCLMFCRSLFVLSSFLLAIVLFVLLQFTTSDYPFGIFKLFLK